MKRAFSVILLSTSLLGCIGTIRLFEKEGRLMGILPLVDGNVMYQEWVSTSDLPKEEVFRRARRWWVDNYRSAKDVFQLVDKETGEIVGKGYGRITFQVSKASLPQIIRLYHTISVDVAEDSYVVTVKDLQIEQANLRGLAVLTSDNTPIERYNLGTVKSVTATFRAVDENARLSIESLKKYIKQPPVLPQIGK